MKNEIQRKKFENTLLINVNGKYCGFSYSNLLLLKKIIKKGLTFQSRNDTIII